MRHLLFATISSKTRNHGLYQHKLQISYRKNVKGNIDNYLPLLIPVARLLIPIYISPFDKDPKPIYCFFYKDKDEMESVKDKFNDKVSTELLKLCKNPQIQIF